MPQREPVAELVQSHRLHIEAAHGCGSGGAPVVVGVELHVGFQYFAGMVVGPPGGPGQHSTIAQVTPQYLIGAVSLATSCAGVRSGIVERELGAGVAPCVAGILEGGIALVIGSVYLEVHHRPVAEPFLTVVDIAALIIRYATVLGL